MDINSNPDNYNDNDVNNGIKTTRNTINTSIICPYCKHTMIYDVYEYVCPSCGYVYEEKEVVQKERAFDKEEYLERTHHGELIPYKTNNTSLGHPIFGAQYNGNKLDPKMLPTFIRLRKYDRYSQNPRLQRLKQALTSLERVSVDLGLPSHIIMRTIDIFTRVAMTGYIKGRKYTTVLAAVLYLACKESSIPHSIKSIANLLGTKPKSVGRCYREIVNNLEMNVPVTETHYINYIVKTATKLALPEKTKRLAISMLKEAHEKHHLYGRHPAAMAAVFIYIACKEDGIKLSQRTIAEAAGVTEVTLRISLYNILKSRSRKRAKAHHD